MRAITPSHAHFRGACVLPRRVIRCRAVRPEQDKRPAVPRAPPPAPGQRQGLEERDRALQEAENQELEPELLITELEAEGWSQSLAEPSGHPLARLLAAVDFSEPGTFDGVPKTEYDPLRDGPLRYLGYANEVGEAFGAWLFAGGVPLSYAVAISYVLFDTVDKWRATHGDAKTKLAARELPPGVNKDRLVALIGAERGIDTLVWQLIASVAAPGFTIHTLVAFATSVLKTVEDTHVGQVAADWTAHALGVPQDAMLELVNKSVPTALGLIAIPFIVHPIDSGVHALLNATLRPLLKRAICKNGGAKAGLPICKRSAPSNSKHGRH